MQTEAQRNATKAYRKKSVKQIVIRFYPSEQELYDWCKEWGASKMKVMLNTIRNGKLMPVTTQEQ